jgi:hypothetical protein
MQCNSGTKVLRVRQNALSEASLKAVCTLAPHGALPAARATRCVLARLEQARRAQV